MAWGGPCSGPLTGRRGRWYAMLAPVEPGVAIAAVLAVLAAVAFVIAARRGRALGASLDTIERLGVERAERDRATSERSAEDAVPARALETGVVRLDATLHVRDANPRAHVLLGHPPGALLGGP